MTEHTADDQSSTDLVEAPLGFHAKDGYHFLRTEDAGVRIVVARGEKRHVVEFDRYTWASILASVSSYGETSDSYHAALNFHDGDAVLVTQAPTAMTWCGVCGAPRDQPHFQAAHAAAGTLDTTGGMSATPPPPPPPGPPQPPIPPAHRPVAQDAD